MSNYWQDRLTRQQNAISNKSIKQTEKQLRKYYRAAARRCIEDFEATYDKLLATIADGREPTPADLYKLDKYWQMQGQLRNELQKLGDREIALLSRAFEANFFEIYYSIDLPNITAYNTISKEAAAQLINSVWLADGKTYSQRVWGSIDKLVDTLNENLLHCVISGKKTTELKQLLQQRFNVTYNAADTIVRTEIAHIQTQAAAQRYKDYGLTKYKYLAGSDKRTCKDGSSNCHDLDGKVFTYAEMREGVNAPPMHPRCRCTIVPVID